ncbi:hypothetical protein BCY84_18142 [Trypanosoma cruzi cruzi]|nr:hypothetical protein BCY84_18142 [Trypanosoma cruzi cruzi]
MMVAADGAAEVYVGARCSKASYMAGAASLLIFVLCVPLSVRAAGSVRATVPALELFRVVFSGSDWQYVYETVAQHHETSVGRAAASTLMNPVSAAVAELLTTSLSTPPGVTGLSVRGCEIDATGGLSVVYAVTRFRGGGELTNTQINNLVRTADASYLRSFYWKNGGRVTESIFVRDATLSAQRETCDLGCQYAVGVAVPILCCAVICIPVFISLVSARRASLRLDPPPPPPPPCAQVCCSRHAATLTSSYMSSGAAASSESGGVANVSLIAPEYVPVTEGLEGCPTGYRPPVERTETDDVYYTRIAQQAFEAEKRRREDENCWRRANGLPLLPELSNSTRKPRVLVVEDRQKTVQDTFVGLDPEARAAAGCTTPEEQRRQQPRRFEPHVPLRDGVAGVSGVLQAAESFHASVSTMDPYRPNRRSVVPSSTVVPMHALDVRHEQPRPSSVASVLGSTGCGAEHNTPANSLHTPLPMTSGPEDPRTGIPPLTAAERRKMPLRDTGLIGGEIVARAPSASEVRGPSNGLRSIVRPFLTEGKPQW